MRYIYVCLSHQRDDFLQFDGNIYIFKMYEILESVPVPVTFGSFWVPNLGSAFYPKLKSGQNIYLRFKKTFYDCFQDFILKT